MKNTMMVIAAVSIALIIGLFLGGKYIAKGELVVAMCVLGDTAIEEEYLSEENLLRLTESTGKVIRSKYPVIASNIQLSNESIGRASKNSRCSQILVALSKGAQ